jgi:hypothetical protein
MPEMPRTAALLVAVLCVTFAAHAAPPQAEAVAAPAPPSVPSAPPVTPPVDRAVLDRVAARYYAPETGGSARPRFITERTLSFEARLLSMTEQGSSPETPPQERHIRLALERHVTEELLSSLGIEGAHDTFDLTALADEARAETDRRIGGEGALMRAASVEQMEPEEVQGHFLRHARALHYLDRNVTPLLSPTDEQLREVFRSSAHPFRDKKLEEVRKDFARWFVAERAKAVESTFLQTARSRVKIIVVGH